MTTPEEQAIQGVIDQIWATYDVDNSGALDKEETKKFVKDTLGNLSGGDEFSDEAFDEVFATFDKDGSGTVEKAEMVVFIKQLLGWELNSVWISFFLSRPGLINYSMSTSFLTLNLKKFIILLIFKKKEAIIKKNVYIHSFLTNYFIL